MATTVANIAKAAFDGVSAAITDAVLDATLDDGASTYEGRVVLGGETAPSGFPLSKAEGRARPAYLEGFSEVAQAGWEVVAGGVTYYIMGVRDIVQAGGFQVASVIASGDMLWKTASFERVSETLDDYGSPVQTWAAIEGADSVSVGLSALSGQERWASDRVEATSRWRLICKPVSGLTEKDRVVIGSRTYAITFVNDVEARGAWQVLDLGLGVAT